MDRALISRWQKKEWGLIGMWQTEKDFNQDVTKSVGLNGNLAKI